MPITDQRAAARPISFVLHDTARGYAPIVHQLAIRPEDLTRNDPSRQAVHQTLGGAWLDDFGVGLSTVNISGHTGWGADARPDGYLEFVALHNTVFEGWHKLRAEVAAIGKDPNLVKLIFDDGLDGFTWVVAPQNFVLKRNKSRPLLSQYQISMTKLNDTVLEESGKTKISKDAAIDSLDQCIGAINSFFGKIKGKIASALGGLLSKVRDFIKLTANVLAKVRAFISGARSLLDPVLELASALTRAAANVMNIFAAIKGIPQMVKAAFMAVKSAFTTAFCLIRNAFGAGGSLPDYSSLYGASNCSSTSGGRPASAYSDKNVFPKLFPAEKSPVSLGASAESSLRKLMVMDPAKVDSSNPNAMTTLGNHMSVISNGTTITA